MENLALNDVLPCIQIWTFIISVILTVFIYKIWRFGKEHPEIFRPDTTAEDQLTLLTKAELRRQFNNKSMISIATVFVWMIGVSMIMLHFGTTNQGWGIIIFALIVILWLILMIRLK